MKGKNIKTDNKKKIIKIFLDNLFYIITLILLIAMEWIGGHEHPSTLTLHNQIQMILIISGLFLLGRSKKMILKDGKFVTSEANKFDKYNKLIGLLGYFFIAIAVALMFFRN
jgi:hypothetical protein